MQPGVFLLCKTKLKVEKPMNELSEFWATYARFKYEAEIILRLFVHGVGKVWEKR